MVILEHSNIHSGRKHDGFFLRFGCIFGTIDGIRAPSTLNPLAREWDDGETLKGADQQRAAVSPFCPTPCAVNRRGVR